jgi:hypothetical protein
MITVNFYTTDGRGDVLVGRVVSTGSSVYCDPPNDPTLRGVMSVPVYTPQGRLSPADGDAFVSALPAYYHSAYLRAVPA